MSGHDRAAAVPQHKSDAERREKARADGAQHAEPVCLDVNVAQSSELSGDDAFLKIFTQIRFDRANAGEALADYGGRDSRSFLHVTTEDPHLLVRVVADVGERRKEYEVQ